MAAVRIVNLVGLAECKLSLAELTTATQKSVMRRAALAGAEPIRQTAQELAPERPPEAGDKVYYSKGGDRRERKPGTLKASIHAGTKLSARQARAAKAEGKSQVEVYVGPAPDPAAIAEEFGNSHQPPHPFMRPAFEGKKDAALTIITGRLETEVAKAAVRARRKSAKIAFGG